MENIGLLVTIRASKFSPSSEIEVCIGRVKEIFGPNLPWWVKKIQPNPTHHISPIQPTWVGLGRVELMGWTNFIIIIIKLSRKKYKYIKKTQRLVSM